MKGNSSVNLGYWLYIFVDVEIDAYIFQVACNIETVGILC